MPDFCIYVLEAIAILQQQREREHDRTAWANAFIGRRLKGLNFIFCVCFSFFSWVQLVSS